MFVRAGEIAERNETAYVRNIKGIIDEIDVAFLQEILDEVIRRRAIEAPPEE